MTIHLVSIHAFGRHGASPGERDAAQEFVIDLDVDARLGGDALSETVDYRDVVQTARRVVEEGSFELLETIAHEVASAVRAIDGVARVRAVVHKPSAAMRLGIDDVSASAELS
jgi:dihydroneopterin aldolase